MTSSTWMMLPATLKAKPSSQKMSRSTIRVQRIEVPVVVLGAPRDGLGIRREHRRRSLVAREQDIERKRTRITDRRERRRRDLQTIAVALEQLALEAGVDPALARELAVVVEDR